MYTKTDKEIYIDQQIRSAGYSMKYAHMHNYYEIFYLKSGNCTYCVNNKSYPLNAGELFFVIPGDTHYTTYEGASSCERIVINFVPEILPESYWESHQNILEKFSHSGKVTLPSRGRKQMEELMTAMLHENNFPDKYSLEFSHLHFMTLLLSLHRNGIFIYEDLKQSTRLSPDIETALSYIAHNLSLPITLEDVAKQINLSPNYLSRKFKQETYTTFKEYITFMRIRRASQMLANTDDSITKIALNCGFNSSNYFKDCFRRIAGVSPRAFRNQKKYSLKYKRNAPQ